MKNYACINGNKIELTDEQVAEITKIATSASVKLSDKAVGDTFKIGNHEFIVLEHSNETTAAILKEILGVSKFSDTSCDFKTSVIKTVLEAFEEKIAGVIGADNLITHTVDLTSNDGLKEYGTTTAKMSLLTADLYRRYVETLDRFKPEKWWWLATPYSTPKHGCDQYVLCVAPSGIIVNYDFFSDVIGVRPILNFVSSIFVSCDE